MQKLNVEETKKILHSMPGTSSRGKHQELRNAIADLKKDEALKLTKEDLLPHAGNKTPFHQMISQLVNKKGNRVVSVWKEGEDVFVLKMV